MWLWNSVFHARGLRHLEVAVVHEMLEAVFNVQCADSFLPHMMLPNEKSDITQSLHLSYGLRLMLEQQQASKFLELSSGSKSNDRKLRCGIGRALLRKRRIVLKLPL